MMSSFMSLGCTGTICYVLFKKFIEDSKNDKEYFRSEIKDTREKFYNELQLLREDAQKDRENFVLCLFLRCAKEKTLKKLVCKAKARSLLYVLQKSKMTQKNEG